MAAVPKVSGLRKGRGKVEGFRGAGMERELKHPKP